MICYKDMTFCSRDCNNEKCDSNKRNIHMPVGLAWMPVAYADFKDCKDYKGGDDE